MARLPIIDSTCSLKDHVANVCRSINFNLYSIGKIRKYLDRPTVEKLVNATITSCHWSPNIILVTVLVDPPPHWSPNVTLVTQLSLIPHLISPPMSHWWLSSHWSPISLVPQCYTGYTVLIGPPSQWFPNVKLVTRFSLVPHPISPPMLHWLHSCHWSPISLVPQCHTGDTVLIGPPSH